LELFMAKSTILAVDDDRIVRKILDQVLSDAGFTVVLAQDGAEALAKLLAAPDLFDAVLLDRMMPNMDGMEVLKAIRSNSHFVALPVIMQTAVVADQLVREGYEEGAYYYITKPYDPGTLVSIVRSAVEKYHQFRSVMAWMVEATAGASLLESGTFRLRTITDARIAASLLGEMADDSVRIGMALKELMENAIEHGNLGIGGEQKARLEAEGGFVQEVERRLTLPENHGKFVRVRFQTADGMVRVSIKDRGQGFDWQSALKPGPESSLLPTSLGIATAKAAHFDTMEYGESGTLVEVTFPASMF
jgi:CheY-like chemotaxis protein/anti-sigma regulatory factor (Ser/Thr protein kinase)